jgi:hypothetical protein
MKHNIIWAKPTGDHRDGKGFVVLCELPDNTVTPYVTWRTESLTEGAERYWGHYHYTYEEAKAEFEARV